MHKQMHLSINTTKPLLIPYKRIAVEGNIGAGKTSLARKISNHLNYRLFEEVFERNKLLKDFYKDALNEKFAMEFSLLMDRTKVIQEAIEGSDSPWVADFWIKKSLVFGKVNLPPELSKLMEESLYLSEQVLPAPDLIIYLDAPTDLILENIRKRSRSYEQTLDQSYLEKVKKEYDSLMHEHKEIPKLKIHTEEFNLLQKDADYEHLVNHLISKDISGFETLK